MSNDVAVVKRSSPVAALAGKFQIEPDKLMEVLRGTVIKPDRNGKAASNEEVAAFCIVADQYGLNPFTREIHAFTDGSRGVVPIVGIDGWTHLVNSRGDFDGCEFEEVEGPDGKPEKITCKMYVKGREHPVCATERFEECKRGTIPWNSMPWRMLRHKAYMQAARYAFGLSGIYDEDEARDIVRNADAKPPVAAPKRIPKAQPEVEVGKPPYESVEPPPVSASEPPPAPPQDNEIQSCAPAQSEGPLIVRGKITDIKTRTGEKNGKTWKKWGVVVDGNIYGTFHESQGSLAESCHADGLEVVIEWEPDSSGKYRNAKKITIAE